MTPLARPVAVPVIRLSILAAVLGVRSSKSWKVIEPLTAMSLLSAAVWVTLIVQNWPLAIVALIPGLSEVTVKVWEWVVPPSTGTW